MDPPFFVAYLRTWLAVDIHSQVLCQACHRYNVRGIGLILDRRSDDADTPHEDILVRLPRLTLGVVGDLFLDRYLDIDASLTEPSIETGLDAYQVTRVRPSPGAAAPSSITSRHSASART